MIKNPIGIMQGRLSPPLHGRLQAFPWATWEQEFTHAHVCGFDLIEWLFDAERYEHNPIWTDAGQESIRRCMTSSGVLVRSVCATYFMAHPFFRVSEPERQQSIAILKQLIRQAANLDIRTILLPVLEVTEIRTTEEEQQFLDSLCEPLSLALHYNIRISVETELPALQYRTLIENARHPMLGVYYDAGNATAKGYDIAADIRILGSQVYGIHIKDRKRGGPNVFLGQGDADFTAFFQVVSQLNYGGPFILETRVGEDYLGTAKKHREFVQHEGRQ